MDTSETYIKMRLGAIPDLGMGTPPLTLTRFYTELVWVDAKGDWYTSDGNEATQLERQDQLQEMVDTDLGKLLQRFYGWIFPDYITNFQDNSKIVGKTFCVDVSFTIGDKAGCPLTSMEQLWLAFVQKELHNKVWDGEAWLKQ